MRIPTTSTACAGRALGALALLTLVAGCGTYVVPASPAAPFKSRMETRTDAMVTVSAAVLGAEESEAWFGTPLAPKGVQPVWLEIRNDGGEPLLLNLLGIDDDYFSPSEAAWRTRRGAGEGGMDEKQLYFNTQHIALIVGPGKTASGFVYTNLDPAFKPVAIELVGDQSAHLFELVLEVPGFVSDFDRVDFGALHPEGTVRDVDLDALRTYLTGLPCCTSTPSGTAPSGPVNMALVGTGEHVLSALVRRGWDVTPTGGDSPGAALGAERSAPMAPRMLFSRVQDVALKKSRPGGAQRSELRLWLAPVTLEDQPVWVGQILRSVGGGPGDVEPVVDEARTYVILDLYNGGEVDRAGYVGGVGRSTLASPAVTGGEGFYVTDGLRVVLFIGGGRQGRREIHWYDWEASPGQLSDLLEPHGGDS